MKFAAKLVCAYVALTVVGFVVELSHVIRNPTLLQNGQKIIFTTYCANDPIAYHVAITMVHIWVFAMAGAGRLVIPFLLLAGHLTVDAATRTVELAAWIAAHGWRELFAILYAVPNL